MRRRPVPARMLLIDDDAMSCEVLGVLLGPAGYRIACEHSGDAALAKLAAGGAVPDVVLTDMEMPGTTGTKLALALRRTCGPDTVILAMSASEPGTNASRFDGFLLKPFTMQDFSTALNMHRELRSQDLTSAFARRPPSKKSARSDGKKPGQLTSVAASSSEMHMDVLEQETVKSDACVTSAHASTVLDERIYGQLAAAMPIRQLHQLYALCIRDARERIDAMRALVGGNDAIQFVRQAHALKGGCGMLGAYEIYGLAADLESAGLEATGLHRDAKVNPLSRLSDACDRLEGMLGSRAPRSSP